ncbi:hypothetical protein [Erythrobacter sp. SG61-1L]|uniref:hypothetical protein n=1 Tax=Erythrobacter sp. SG61-1L TaxID=1603897 RepID=UPI0012E17D95|nr:hypothetical protein [Erythrobacter sp. SG61-1L]
MQANPPWVSAIPIIVATLALIGVLLTISIQWRNFNKQLRSLHSLKISEIHQARINNLRDAMAMFQSYGVTPDLDNFRTREWYESGTKIELLMNPEDPDYEELQNAMYAFLGVADIESRYGANPHYITVCQRILKRELSSLEQKIWQAAKTDGPLN